MKNTYIPGTTIFFPFDPGDLDLSAVDTITFAFADDSRQCVVTKHYPADTTTTQDGVVLVPLTQEDTALLPHGGIAQAQINFSDHSVMKTLETILRYNPTINTEFIAGNAPSISAFEAVDWHELDFASQVIQVNMTVSGVPDGSVTAAKLAPAVRENVEAVPELKQDLDELDSLIISRPNMLDSRCVIKQYEYISGTTGQIAQNPSGSQYWALETYLPIEQGKTYICNCRVGYFYFYDSEKNYVERVATNQTSATWKYLTINDSRHKFVRVYFDASGDTVRWIDNWFFGEKQENAVYTDLPSTTTADVVAKYHFVTDDVADGGKDDFSDFIGKFEKQSYNWVNGFIQPSGEMTTSSAYRRSDFVEVPNNAMLYRLKDYSIGSSLCSIAFYSTNDKNEIISYVAFSADVGEFVGVIPPNAKYYGVSKLGTNNDYSVELFINKEIGQLINDNSHNILQVKNSRMLTDGLGFVAFSKFASVGDSLSVGYNTQSDGTVVQKDLEHSWGKYVERKTGCVSYWTGVHGATCKSWLTTASTTWGLNYTKTLGKMPLYVVCMGANEDSTKLGTIADVGTNADTLYAYASKVITELRAISPKCFIVCTGISRKQANKTINAVFKAICDLYDKCYFMDCWDEFNHTPFSNYYFASHYSANGYAMMAQLFDYKLKELMTNHVEDFKYINECEV